VTGVTQIKLAAVNKNKLFMTETSEKKTNIGLLVAFTITTMLGMFNHGFSVASWNIFQTPFKIRNDWDDD
jgi:hypothetical protein